MADIYITRRGGGGGKLKATDAVLCVTAPSSSVVNISKGGVTQNVEWRINTGSSLYTYFLVVKSSKFDSVIPWDISATYGNTVENVSVIIDSADAYCVDFDFKKYIYSHGTTLIPLSSRKESNANVVFGTEYISQSGSNSYGYSNVYTTNKIDMTDYNSVVFLIDYRGNANSGNKLKVGATSTNSSWPTWVATATPTVQSEVIQTIKVDISANTGEFYVFIGGTVTTRIYEIYLSKE